MGGGRGGFVWLPIGGDLSVDSSWIFVLTRVNFSFLASQRVSLGDVNVMEVKDVAEDVVGGTLRGGGLDVRRRSEFARRELSRRRVTRRRRLGFHHSEIAGMPIKRQDSRGLASIRGIVTIFLTLIDGFVSDEPDEQGLWKRIE